MSSKVIVVILCVSASVTMLPATYTLLYYIIMLKNRVPLRHFQDMDCADFIEKALIESFGNHNN